MIIRCSISWKSCPSLCCFGDSDEGSGGREEQPKDPRVKKKLVAESQQLCNRPTHYVPMPEILP